MSELKTLRDLPTFKDKRGHCIGGETIYADAVDISELRQAAIEWIKALVSSTDMFGDCYEYYKDYAEQEDEYDPSTTINWIKMFFSISDEDLK